MKKQYEVTVREQRDTIRSTQIEASSEEEARAIAESQDWRTWDSVSEDEGYSEIVNIQEWHRWSNDPQTPAQKQAVIREWMEHLLIGKSGLCQCPSCQWARAHINPEPNQQ